MHNPFPFALKLNPRAYTVHNLPEMCRSLYFRSSFSWRCRRSLFYSIQHCRSTADGALNSSATDTSAQPTLIRPQAEYTGPRSHRRVDRLGQLLWCCTTLSTQKRGAFHWATTTPHLQGCRGPARIGLRTRTLAQVRFGVRFSTVLGGPVWGSACARYGPNQTSP